MGSDLESERRRIGVLRSMIADALRCAQTIAGRAQETVSGQPVIFEFRKVEKAIGNLIEGPEMHDLFKFAIPPDATPND